MQRNLTQDPFGVTVAVCCHNSEARLPTALRRLAEQKVPPGVAWEVLVVDNASTDRTAEVALERWPAGHPAPLRAVREPRLGLSNARLRSFNEARYELVSFVDDDNWVASDWVATVFAVMTEHPEAGACGGPSEAVFEVPAPAWFSAYEGKYGCGSQAEASTVGAWTDRFLRGAGLTVRKTAWQQLLRSGFRPRLVGRQGAAVSCSEDIELCMALNLAGWRLWYEPRLRLQHYMPAGRLTWGYLRRMARAIGEAGSLLDAYTFWGPGRAIRRCWQAKAFVASGRLLLLFLQRPQLLAGAIGEGSDFAVRWEMAFGRLQGLVRRRGERNELFREVAAFRARLQTQQPQPQPPGQKPTALARGPSLTHF